MRESRGRCRCIGPIFLAVRCKLALCLTAQAAPFGIHTLDILSFAFLKLIRYTNPVFALPWSMMQPIDESLPLCAREEDHSEVGKSEIIAALCGFDNECGQIVHSG